MRPNTSPTVAFLDIGVLVFREGLECILVLAAITASMTGAKQTHRRPVAIGAGIAFGATLITWVIAVGIVGSLMDNVPALDLQAATGLLAVIVLLVIMNWFFHKDLLGRLDSGAQPPAESAPRRSPNGTGRSRFVVGSGPVGIHLALSRRI